MGQTLIFNSFSVECGCIAILLISVSLLVDTNETKTFVATPIRQMSLADDYDVSEQIVYVSSLGRI